MVERQITSTRPEAHPAPYGRVFLLLVLATGAELVLASSSLGREVRTSIFLLFTIFKAGLVAAFFMHLRRDSKYYSYVILFPATMLLFFILLTLAV